MKVGKYLTPRSLLLFLTLAACWIIALRDYEGIQSQILAGRYAKFFWFERLYKSENFFYGPLALLPLTWLINSGEAIIRIIGIFLNSLSLIFIWYAMMLLYPPLKEKKALKYWILIWFISLPSTLSSFAVHNYDLLAVALIVASETYRNHPSRKAAFFSGWGEIWATEILFLPLLMALHHFWRGSKVYKRGLWISALIGLALPTIAFQVKETWHLYSVFLSNLQNTLNVKWMSLTTFIQVFSLFIFVFYLRFSFKLRKKKNQRPNNYLFAFGLATLGLFKCSLGTGPSLFLVPAFAALFEMRMRGFDDKKTLVGILFSIFLISSESLFHFIGKTTLGTLPMISISFLGSFLLCITLFFNIRSIDWR